MTPQEELELYKCFAACLSKQVLYLWGKVADYDEGMTNKELQKIMQPYEDLRETMKIGRG
jgi:hypothetical protein